MPSIRAAAAGARRASIRFPFVLLAALAAAAIGSVLVGRGRTSEPLEAALAAATLGLPLLTGLALAAGRTGSRQLAIALGLLGIALLAGVAPEPGSAVQARPR